MSWDNSSQPSAARCGESTACEACGEVLTCGAALAGCWCSEIKLSEAALTELRARYERCLCRACLELIAGREKETIGDRHA